MKNKDQLKKELESFNGLWEGGTTLVKQGWNRVSLVGLLKILLNLLFGLVKINMAIVLISII